MTYKDILLEYILEKLKKKNRDQVNIFPHK